MESLDRVQRIAGLGSMEVDLASGKFAWSPGACAIFGIEPDAIEPTAEFVFGLVHPDDRDAVVEAARKARTTGSAVAPLEFRIIRPDGAERIVYRENAIECDETGLPRRLVLTFKDITELKATEGRLRQLMESLDRGQRLAHMGSYTRYLDGAGEWSAEVYRIFGVDPQSYQADVDGFLSLVVPEDRPKLLEAYRLTAAEICPDPLEYRIRRPSGEIRHIHRISELIRDRSGKVIGAGGTLWDVTELRAAEERQRELERQLMHSQKLKAVGTLAGGIAHDLNNALVPILTLCHLALANTPQGTELREDIETIKLAAERAQDLVRRILVFSRKEDEQRTQVDLAAVIGTTLRMLRPTLPSTLHLIERIEPVPPLFADANELQQVIVNLVTNASQAIGAAHGTITIGLELADAAPGSAKEAPQSMIRLWVADTGSGMDAETIERIFEPFFTTKDVGEGTGLGLSVVHGIVTRQHGRIEVRSKIGEGSEFSILLPLTADPALTADAA